MINRILIRVKVVQILYSYLCEENDKPSDAKQALELSLNASFELYHYLLLLPVELTRLQDRRLDNAKNKYLPTKEDLNPNTKFIDNLFVRKLEQCEALQDFVAERGLSWDGKEAYLRLILDKIINSDIYADYMSSEEQSLEKDAEFWRTVMKRIILPDDDLVEVLEDISIYWNDDLDVIGTFVLKTIKKISTEGVLELLPQFKDDEDRRYAGLLLDSALKHREEYMELIDRFVSKDSWDTERLAFMDVVILFVAISELEYVPSVPVVVTINEYVEIAKNYSTQKSGSFINGILISIINYLKSAGRLNKDIIK